MLSEGESEMEAEVGVGRLQMLRTWTLWYLDVEGRTSHVQGCGKRKTHEGSRFS